MNGMHGTLVALATLLLTACSSAPLPNFFPSSLDVHTDRAYVLASVPDSEAFAGQNSWEIPSVTFLVSINKDGSIASAQPLAADTNGYVNQVLTDKDGVTVLLAHQRSEASRMRCELVRLTR